MRPADLLEGNYLSDGWKVTRRLTRSAGATGGTFSVPYEVEREGEAGAIEKAFLKALDFTVVQNMAMPVADAFQVLTKAYVFERDVVLRCATARMKNVVKGVSAGEVKVDNPAVDPILSSVPYIVFERADGDIRSIMSSKLRAFDEAWAFRVLHGTANGLRQLHQSGIAHQDLKPSNVMSVNEIAKLGDLGRASVHDDSGPFDNRVFAGDWTYAPLEFHYREVQSDDRVRRRAGDTYQLGSVAVFLLTGAGMTALIGSELAPTFHWRTWPGDYRNALPYVREAFNRVIEHLNLASSARIRDAVIPIIRELCDPDPLVRGNPRCGAGIARYSMDRYVSIFDRLAKTAEIELRRASL